MPDFVELEADFFADPSERFVPDFVELEADFFAEPLERVVLDFVELEADFFADPFERFVPGFVELEADFFAEPLERLLPDFVELEADFFAEPLERVVLDFETADEFLDELLPLPEELLFVLELFLAGRAAGLAAGFCDPALALEALLDFFALDLVLVAVFFVLDGFAELDDFELPAFASFRLRVAAALRAESEREAFFAEAGFFVPPPPSLSPPPLCLFTVAHARLSASFSLTPLSS